MRLSPVPPPAHCFEKLNYFFDNFSIQMKTVLWPLDPGPLSLHVSVTVTVTVHRGFNEH